MDGEIHLPLAKTFREARPVSHKRNETIHGHVFCSFLALLLIKELQNRLEFKEYDLEWSDVIRDLDRFEEVEAEQAGKRFFARNPNQGNLWEGFPSCRGHSISNFATGPNRETRDLIHSPKQKLNVTPSSLLDGVMYCFYRIIIFQL
ncbi:MAG: hypothetical protein HQK55_09610 [Deltaproteobacteria bacterium]|nr:hypothetical protein [Deltaproteobacteria bacterium]